MPKSLKEAEKCLRKLGDRMELAWQKLYPVTEKDLEAVRAVVRENWDKNQSLAREAAKARQAESQSHTQEKPLRPKEHKQARSQQHKRQRGR